MSRTPSPNPFRIPTLARLRRIEQEAKAWRQAIDHLGDAPGDATRRRILDAIASQPGIHKSEIGRRTQLGWGTIGHHLTILRRQGLVEGRRFGRHLHFALVAKETPHDMALLRCLRMPYTNRIIQFLTDFPNSGPSMIGARLDVSTKTVRRHLDALSEAGVVEGDGAYHPKYAMCPDDAMQALLDAAPTTQMDDRPETA